MLKFILFSCISVTLLNCCGKNSNSSSDEPSSNLPDLGDPCALKAIFNCKGEEIDDSEVNSKEVAWLELDSKNKEHQKFNGVGLYNNGCTATLIDVGGKDAGVKDAPAYLVSNGHCIKYSQGDMEMVDPTGVFTTEQLTENRGKSIAFNYYTNNSSFIRSTVKDVHFASMYKTDVSVIELEDTYESLIKLGVHSYKLATKEPTVGQKAMNVGFPLSGVLVKGLRYSICLMGKNVKLEEGPFNFGNSFQHYCSIVGGNSGSPIFDRDTGEIIAVNNTTTTDSAKGSEDCSLNWPCEVSSDGSKKSIEGINYAQSIAFISGCFVKGKWDITAATCQAKKYL